MGALLVATACGGAAERQAEPASQAKSSVTSAGGSATKAGQGVSDALSLPLSFEPNVGQAVQTADFMTRTGGGGTFAFAPSGVVMATADDEVVRMRFVGAGSSPHVVANQRRAGVVNYLSGSDPAAWRTGVPTYGTLEYTDLYEGIRLAYTGSEGRLKGTWTVAAGADPSQIQWRYDGARVRVDQAGDLRIRTRRGGPDGATVVERAPVAWQTKDGERVDVPVRYRVGPDGTVGFALGEYDRSRPLTIDPEVVLSTYLGGVSYDEAKDVAVDADGAILVTGMTNSGTFPLRNPVQSEQLGGHMAFVTKLSPDGSSLVYSTFLEGGLDDWGNAVEVDAAGNAYVAGYTDSPTFPTTPGAHKEADGEHVSHGFVTKFDPSGGLLYSTLVGFGGYAETYGLAVDDAGSAHVAGFVSSSASECPGSNDAFVAKLDPTGSSLDYRTCFGGGEGAPGWPDNENDIAHDIALDSAGNAHVTGYTESLDFPTTSDAVQPDYAGGFAYGEGFGDAFVTTFDTTGAITYSSYHGGTASDYAWAIAVDSAGSAYLTGVTGSADFPTTAGALQESYAVRDAFVTKLAPGGDTLAYSTYLGGGEATGNGYAREEPGDIAVDADGHAWVVGRTDSTDFPTEQPIQPSLGCCIGAEDAFVTELSADGTGLLFSSYLGGELPDWAYGVALDGTGNVYVAGLADSYDFPTTAGAFQPEAAGIPDAFVTKIGEGGGDGGGDEPDGPVAITRAEYRDSKQELRVEATSPAPTATLTVEVATTGEVIGTLDGKNGRYRSTFNWPRNPERITVRSSEGGSATREVTLR